MTAAHHVRKAVIPAAGLGTRFLPATKAIPKEMLPIVDVPTIQLVIEEAVHAGITDVVVANGRMRIRQMVEKPKPGTAPSRWAIVGRYVLPPSIFPHLAATKPGAGGEIQLTDGLVKLAESPQGMYGVVVKGIRHDAGDRLG